MISTYQTVLNGIRLGDTIGGPTQKAAIVAESLSACQTLDIDDLGARYLRWWRSGAFDTGPTFAIVFSKIDQGILPVESVLAADAELNGMTAGCSPAQRISPLAACPDIPTEKIATLARQEARITHLHPEAGDAAAIVALICRLFMEGKLLQQASDWLDQHENSAWAAVQRASVSDSGRASDVVRTALHCLANASEPLTESFRISGDNNYAPPVVGALIAAKGR